jgi:hypothetical protein
MRLTKEAARELIRSDLAFTKGLPSSEFLDECMGTLRDYGFWQLSDRAGISYDPPRRGEAFDFDMGECYELEVL